MKKCLIFILFLAGLSANANHLEGGFFTYNYIGRGLSNTNNLRYHVLLTLYMVCNPILGQVDAQMNFIFFDADNYQMVQNISVPRYTVPINNHFIILALIEIRNQKSKR
ncbi:MAG: hypothetical protein C4329_08585 [Chitinophagaceae bacterium]